MKQIRQPRYEQVRRQQVREGMERRIRTSKHVGGSKVPDSSRDGPIAEALVVRVAVRESLRHGSTKLLKYLLRRPVHLPLRVPSPQSHG